MHLIGNSSADCRLQYCRDSLHWASLNHIPFGKSFSCPTYTCTTGAGDKSGVWTDSFLTLSRYIFTFLSLSGSKSTFLTDIERKKDLKVEENKLCCHPSQAIVTWRCENIVVLQPKVSQKCPRGVSWMCDPDMSPWKRGK